MRQFLFMCASSCISYRSGGIRIPKADERRDHNAACIGNPISFGKQGLCAEYCIKRTAMKLIQLSSRHKGQGVSSYFHIEMC